VSAIVHAIVRAGLHRQYNPRPQVSKIGRIFLTADGDAYYHVYVDEDLPKKFRAKVDERTDDLLLRVPGGKLVASGLEFLNDAEDPETPNTDGFDPDASSHVLIENCFVYGGDDAVAIKSAGYSGINRDVRDIVVRGGVFLTRKSALKVGTETRTGSFRDITFERNDVLLCDRGMVIYCYDGATCADIRFIDNRFEAPYADSKQRLIDFVIKDRGGAGQIRNVLIRNCRAERQWPQGSTMCGLDVQHRITNIRFERYIVAGKVCRSAEAAGLHIQEHVADVSFSLQPGKDR